MRTLKILGSTFCVALSLVSRPGSALAAETGRGERAAYSQSTPVDEAEEPDGVTGWFRLDTDGLGTQFWVGASHPWGGLTIESDIYVDGPVAELDLGVSLQPTDALLVFPMIGIAFDFETTDVASLVAPLLFTIYNTGSIYFESWISGIWSSLFDDDTEDLFETRNFLLYHLNDTISAGVQTELTYRLNQPLAQKRGVVNLPVGGRVNVAYGKNNTLGIFLGYETEASDGADGIAGRFTFVRTW